MVLGKRYYCEDAFGNPRECYRDGFWYTEVSKLAMPTAHEQQTKPRHRKD